MEKTLEILSKHGSKAKSADAKILAKPIGYGHWSAYVFTRCVNGYRYVDIMELSLDSIYSPCYRREIRIDSSNKEKMNALYLHLQRDEGYRFMGNYVKDICGGYHL